MNKRGGFLPIIIIIAVFTAALFAAVCIPEKAYAFDPPTQGSDNATDVVLWHGDNSTITIQSGNVTVTLDLTGILEMQNDVNDHKAELDRENHVETFKQWGLFIFIMFIIVLAFWHRDPLVYWLACIVSIAYSGVMAFAQDDWRIAAVFVVFGIICGMKASKEK